VLLQLENISELKMNTEQIIETAIQGHASTRDAIRWAIQQEREACAKVCEYLDAEYEGEDVLGTWCAAAIRARGNE
jgi:post-segregation antitoxin (ccd killing protein)